jgi:uncharacterized protein YjbI with pentapeptide repeats
MPAIKNVEWDLCKRCKESKEPSDVGIRLPDSELCWAHAFETSTKDPGGKAVGAFKAALDRLGTQEASLDARGVTITAELLEHMLASARREDNKPVLKKAQFTRANFHDPQGKKLSFEDVIFEGSTNFRGAVFKQAADFTGAEFRASVEFIKAEFEHHVWFRRAIFHDNTFFAMTTFKRVAWFQDAVFKEMAAFHSVTPQYGGKMIMDTPGMDPATFQGEANFQDATFEEARFDGVAFEANVRFAGSTFERACWNKASFKGHPVAFERASFKQESSFDNSAFANEADFTDAKFEKWAWFGGAAFEKGAVFDGAVFGETASAPEAYQFRNQKVPSRERTGVPEAGFDRAVFQGMVGFTKATFKTKATFDGAKFQKQVRFNEATFQREVVFDGAIFTDRAFFRQARFQQAVRFTGATFERGCNLREATFAGQTLFRAVTFAVGAYFREVTFLGSPDFTRAAFTGEANFTDAKLAQGADFERSRFDGEVLFDDTQVGGERVSLRRASFAQPVALTVASSQLDCTGSQFLRGANLRAADSQILLDEAEFGGPSLLDEAEFGGPSLVGAPAGSSADRPADSRAKRPRVLSLRRANTANLVLADVDLAACRFVGAHNLDQLRLEGDVNFAPPPSGLRWGRAWPPVWWWTRRRTVAEEHLWRQTKPKRAGWYSAQCQPAAAASTEESEQVRPADVARVYRDLRKSYEDRKYEPGAADFYYGEMEMRRHAEETSAGEGFVLWLYWLISGYALRATRALGALLVVVLAAAVLFASVGFIPADPLASRLVGVSKEGALQYERKCVYGEQANKQCANRPEGWQLFRKQFPAALAFSAESTTSLLRAPQRPLHTVGEWTQVALRLLGALLFALAVLSVRGRVKR